MDEFRNAFFQKHLVGLENGERSSRGDDCRIVAMCFRQTGKHAMFFGYKAPGFFRLNAFEQLYADAVHLRGMQQIPFFLPGVFERHHSRVKGIMTGLAERQEIACLIASVLATKDDVMHIAAEQGINGIFSGEKT